MSSPDFALGEIDAVQLDDGLQCAQDAAAYSGGSASLHKPIRPTEKLGQCARPRHTMRTAIAPTAA